ncbi:hypothetical protein TSA6c_17370 [Azospirillum sp. TSA6c]|nr:hypothetical protein TSA6c_17370 [Azospirillum sp. TSA6c]
MPSTTFRTQDPRMRREGQTAAYRPALDAGSPPHARGRGSVGFPADHLQRFTPSCTGKRAAPRTVAEACTGYPRIAGMEPAFRHAPWCAAVHPGLFGEEFADQNEATIYYGSPLMHGKGFIFW